MSTAMITTTIMTTITTIQPGPTLNPELTREIEVEVPADEVSKTYKNVIKRYQKLARIPGFRAGKVPESLVRSKFAKELRQEVLEALVPERFPHGDQRAQAAAGIGAAVAGSATDRGSPLRFKAAFEVLPEFDVAGYDTVRVEKPKIELTEDEFEAELGRMLDSQATVERWKKSARWWKATGRRSSSAARSSRWRRR